jgi:cytochrome d ubiquinol oxidase subunit I
MNGGAARRGHGPRRPAARPVQFAFTIAFHILFPAFTIGLASYLAVLEGLWLTTKRDLFKTLYLFWVKVFAISFGMGVVSGVVMSYQLGTNWSEFLRVTGNVLGPLFALEVLTAFFLEASFLGIMLFGWKKVGPGLHFTATVMVALGTALSTFWIISANSWMQTPAGFAMGEGGRLIATDWFKVVFNPSFPSRLIHMVTAAYLTTSLVVAGASAYQLLKHRDHAPSRTALKMAVGLFALLAPPSSSSATGRARSSASTSRSSERPSRVIGPPAPTSRCTSSACPTGRRRPTTSSSACRAWGI